MRRLRSPAASPATTAPAPTALEPVITPTPEEWQAFTALQAPARPEKPVTVIEEANGRSRMAPSRRGYANGHSSMQRYPYMPGKLYEIYSSALPYAEPRPSSAASGKRRAGAPGAARVETSGLKAALAPPG